MTANQALLHRFVEGAPGVPVLLTGNSMGGMIPLLGRRPVPPRWPA